ncbi:MAG: hypothetical protein SVX43_21115 [Cyanobacteriota bacterium]|nr:hypothetical protein [Cyanobacteriota bacterium]
MAYWVKIDYERKAYFIDLDRISVFICAPNGRLTFWLPASSIPIILNRQSNLEAYYKIHDYIKQLTSQSLGRTWVKLFYDRKEYIIDLDRIGSFCYANKKLTFWLPESSTPIVLSEQIEPEAYEKVKDFLTQKTGKPIDS